MIYKCTRSNDIRSAKEALLLGTSPKGGLYVPTELPTMDFEKYRFLSYGKLATKILTPFFKDLGDLSFIEGIYDRKIKEIPIRSFDDISFLELYHGPTFAFKDFALSLLPEFLNRARPNNIENIRVITATSGDTGSATLKAFEGVRGTEAIVFYPHGMVSWVQEAQMQIDSPNLFTASIKGNFDDCQAGVKRVFADEELRERLKAKGTLISSANSINIGRLLPQVIYYVYGYLRLCDKGLKYGELIDIAVPTGNFGNILAGYYAKKMGLPIDTLICASNDNDVLTKFFNEGEYVKKENLINTISPSMDILISSNLERLLYHESSDKEVNAMMNDLKEKGRFKWNRKKIKGFKGEMASEEEILKMIKKIYEDYNYLIDPHTGVAVVALNKLGIKRPTLIISTAHPYKFPRAMIEAISNEKSEDIEKLSHITHTQAPTELMESLRNKKSVEKFYNIEDISMISERTIYANKS